MLEWAQMVKLSRRVSGSKADVADAVLEGIQRGLYSRLYSVEGKLHEQKKELSGGP